MEMYVNLNGNFVLSSEPVLYNHNRSFHYGDSVFESIRFANGKPQFLSYHFERLFDAMRTMQMEPNKLLNEEYIEALIMELAKINYINMDGRIRLTVFRAGGGYYLPGTNETDFMVELFPIETVNYVLNQKGHIISSYTKYKKDQDFLSSFKCGQSMLYVLASMYKDSQALDDCLIMNKNGHIIEATSSNIFAVKKNEFFTPPVSDGCIDGVMRKVIFDMCKASDLRIQELSFTEEFLLSADEVFLTNAIVGVNWVLAYKNKRYFNNTSKKIIDALNHFITTNHTVSEENG